MDRISLQRHLMAGAVFLLLGLTSATYAKPSVGDDPFTPGTLKFAEYAFTPSTDGCPMYTTMYFPLDAGTYTPIFFLGGFYDFVTSDFYSETLGYIAQHGYIVFGIDYYQLSTAKKMYGWDKNHPRWEVAVSEDYATIKTQMDWLLANVTDQTDSKPDWSRLTTMCHSASCDITLKFVRDYPDYAAGTIYLDPMSFQSAFMDPIDSATVSLSYVSQKSFDFPYCCIDGVSYKKFYDLMTSRKVRMMVDNAGHCDVLNVDIWETCAFTDICPVGDKDMLTTYKQFTASIIHAFLQWSLYSDDNMMYYVTNTTAMPLPVENLEYQV